jgi:hypothetical protein
VIFIPKPVKDPKFTQNYRSISLVSNVGKVVEKVILTRLVKISPNLYHTHTIYINDDQPALFFWTWLKPSGRMDLFISSTRQAMVKLINSFLKLCLSCENRTRTLDRTRNRGRCPTGFGALADPVRNLHCRHPQTRRNKDRVVCRRHCNSHALGLLKAWKRGFACGNRCESRKE